MFRMNNLVYIEICKHKNQMSMLPQDCVTF